MATRQPLPIPALTEAQVERFSRSFVQVASGCWEWRRKTLPSGYGRLCVNGRYYRAHRLAYAFFNGVDPGPLLVCHECDNPKCVNPSHLWLGTQTHNMRDASAKGRTAFVRGYPTHCIKCGHHRTDDDVFGDSSRRCANCRRVRQSLRKSRSI